MQTSLPLTCFTLALAVVVTPPALFAQSTKPADDTVQLSVFTVTESSDNSYVASKSITGTRVRTPIKDLTFTVNVITSEFLQDFAYFEINDLGYTSSVNNFDNGGGNVNIRGYGATSYLRNGFLRLGLVDRVNVDRIEVINGPVAAIYGMTTLPPAGRGNEADDEVVGEVSRDSFASLAVKNGFGRGGNDRFRSAKNGNVRHRRARDEKAPRHPPAR